jgi:RNase P subunit RPR2
MKYHNFCHICESILQPFLTTPILELRDGELRQICEECADKEFPGWDDDDESDLDD